VRAKDDTRAAELDALLTPQQASDFLGLSPPTLQRHRSEGTGPKFVKLGKRRIAYRPPDLLAWIEARLAASTADARERGLTT
jgi:predicted DNA-binding transcriptional regulator AlpA